MGCDRLPHDVRGGDLPPNAEEGCRGPCDLPRDQGGLPVCPYGKRDKRAGFFSNTTYPLCVVRLRCFYRDSMASTPPVRL